MLNHGGIMELLSLLTLRFSACDFPLPYSFAIVSEKMYFYSLRRLSLLCTPFSRSLPMHSGGRLWTGRSGLKPPSAGRRHWSRKGAGRAVEVGKLFVPPSFRGTNTLSFFPLFPSPFFLLPVQVLYCLRYNHHER